MGQVTTGFAQRDQRLQALAALGHVFFGQDGFVQAKFLHQGPFLGLADLHAQRFDLFGGGRGGYGLGLPFEVRFDVRQVCVVAHVVTGGGFRLAAAFGAGFGGCAVSGGGFGGAAWFLLGRFFGGDGGFLQIFGWLRCGHCFGFRGGRVRLCGSFGCSRLGAFGGGGDFACCRFRHCFRNGWSGLGRLRGLWSRHGTTSGSKKDNEKKTSATGPARSGTGRITGQNHLGRWTCAITAVLSAGEKPPMARCMGEHLVCSPCGGVAGGARWHPMGRVRRCCCRSCRQQTLHYIHLAIFQVPEMSVSGL